MQAMLRSAPPQVGQVSMSMPKTRLRRCAQVNAMEGMYAGFAGAKTGQCCPALRRRFLLLFLEGFGLVTLPPLPRCHRGAVSTVGGKYAMEAGQIDPRLGHQGGQPGDEIQRLEDNVCRAVAVRRLQLVPDSAVRRERQSLLRNGRPADAATQPLKLLALIRPRHNAGVQGEPGHLADPGIERLLTPRQRL